jgi:hypothetical protein
MVLHPQRPSYERGHPGSSSSQPAWHLPPGNVSKPSPGEQCEADCYIAGDNLYAMQSFKSNLRAFSPGPSPSLFWPCYSEQQARRPKKLSKEVLPSIFDMDPFIRISWKIYLFIYLVALGFKLRASSLLGRPSTTRATPSALVGKSFRNTESWECQKSLESSMTTFNLVGCCVPQDSFSSFSSTMVQTQGFMLARHLRPAALFVWYFFFFFWDRVCLPRLAWITILLF